MLAERGPDEFYTGDLATEMTADLEAHGAWVTAVIEEIVAISEENTVNLPTGEKAFDAPLVGYSNGADPLFEQYVAHIGDFYLTPLDIYKNTFPQDTTVAPGDLTVISWILPSTTRIRNEQAAAVRRPSERWRSGSDLPVATRTPMSRTWP